MQECFKANPKTNRHQTIPNTTISKKKNKKKEKKKEKKEEREIENKTDQDQWR